jgi:competence ComEA-like helix-hairpin-helix protein
MSHRKMVVLFGSTLFCIVFMFGGTAAGQAKAAAHPKIDLNKATAEQLGKIPGLTPALAKSIADFRERSGPFKVPEDLLKVKGMTKEILSKLNLKLDKGILFITPASPPSDEDEEEPSLKPSKC